MNKINFNSISESEFARLEDNAIDGCLIYDDFPAAEYKYFSKLSKLGYKNRHDGWSKELCEEMQRDYKKEYLSEKEHSRRFFDMACRMQDNIRRGELMISEVEKADPPKDKLRLALKAIELMTCQKGFAERNLKG